MIFKKLVLSFSVLLLAHTTAADVATYRDGTFVLSTGAIVNADNTVNYFRDIVFTTNANGTLTLISAAVRENTGSSVEGEAGYLENGQVFVPRGAEFVVDGEAYYYGDIVLSVSNDDTLTLVSAESRTAAVITEVSIQSYTGFPSFVTVNVSGNKSRSCVELEEAGFHRQQEQNGRVFTIIVAEAELDDGVSCAPSPTPFSMTVDLPVCTCTPGDYTAIVNGTHRAFFTLVE